MGSDIQLTTPMGQSLQLAVENGASIETLERMMAMVERERDYQAKVNFDMALSRVQKSITKIARDMTGDKGTKYSSFEALDGALRPHYTGEEFSLSFDASPDPPEGHQVFIAYLSRM